MNWKDQKRLLGFDDTWVLLLGIPLLGFAIPLLFFNATLANGLSEYMPNFASSLMFTVAYWLTVRAIIIRMRRQFPQHDQVRQRLLYSLLGILAAFLIIHFGLGIVHERFFPHDPADQVSDFNYAVASLTIILLVVSIYEGVYFYSRWQDSLLEQERLRRENVESQLEGLRNQVNPHFLFNSLNTLVYIIPEDSARAVEFVHKLSKVYRYILEIKDKKLISVEEELRFLESYIFLVKERFGDNLQVQVDMPASLYSTKMVPLSLQILFENAIKHNIISSDKPLYIRMFVEEDRIVIINNLQLKHQVMNSTGIGLQNIKNRYAFFCDRPVVIKKEGGAFRVELPLLDVPVEAAV